MILFSYLNNSFISKKNPLKSKKNFTYFFEKIRKIVYYIFLILKIWSNLSEIGSRGFHETPVEKGNYVLIKNIFYL